jgi:hypothetical protein
MENLYSLYDALVSINVPSDKARAVVDAMERDMGTTLATKQDLLLVRQEVENRYELLSREIGSLRTDMDRGFEGLRREFGSEFAAMRKETGMEFALVRQESSSEVALLRKDMQTMRLSIIGWLGSSLVAGVGVILAAMRLWM